MGKFDSVWLREKGREGVKVKSVLTDVAEST